MADKLATATQAHKVLILKNWICSADTKIPEKLCSAIVRCLSNGAEVYIALLHPRSQSARRRKNELSVDVPEQIAGTIVSLQKLVTDIQNETDSKKLLSNLYIICHDTLPTLQLICCIDNAYDEGWAQIAFYTNGNSANNSEQFEIKLSKKGSGDKSRLKDQVAAHAKNLIRKFASRPTSGDFVELKLEDANFSFDTLAGSPLTIEAEDFAYNHNSIEDASVGTHVDAISTAVSQLLDKSGSHSIGFLNFVEILYRQSFALQGDARPLGIKGIFLRLEPKIIEQELKDMTEGQEFVIFDNWLVGTDGIFRGRQAFLDALHRKVAITVILLHPNSVLVDRRRAEICGDKEVVSVRGNIIETIFEFQRISDGLPEGKLKVFCHDCIPSFQGIHGAKTSVIGLYFKGVQANAGPQLQVTNGDWIGKRVKEHLDYVRNHSQRIVEIDLKKNIRDQLDGLFIPAQASDVGEILCNLKPSEATSFAEALISQANVSYVKGYRDEFKLSRIANKRCNFNPATRLSQLDHLLVTLALHNTLRKSELALELNDLELKLMISLFTRLTEANLQIMAKSEKAITMAPPLIRKLGKVLRFLSDQPPP